MAGDFNIQDNDWDPLFPHHSAHSDDLITIADSFNLDLSSPTNPGPTRFADNPRDNNSAINLMFINSRNHGFNNHTIMENKRLSLDHAPLYVKIQINPVNINIWKRSIKTESNDKMKYDSYILSQTVSLRSNNLTTPKEVETFTREIAQVFMDAWNKFSKEYKITRQSKEWWNQECTSKLNKYRNTKNLNNWKGFKQATRTAKNKFFKENIHEIAVSNK